MRSEIIRLEPLSRWQVLFSDPGSWRTGIYAPEYADAAQIQVFEKHNCPELFICIKARMGLLVFNGKEEYTIELEPLDAVLIQDYHNGFRIDSDGFFIVVEQSSFVTEYIERSTGKTLKTVHT